MNEKIFFWKKYGIGILIITSITVCAIINNAPVKASNENEIVLNFSFKEPEISEINISNVTYHKVILLDSPTIGSTGLPLLPVKLLKVLLPQKGILKSINITFEGNTSLGEGYNVLLGTNQNFSGEQNVSNESYFDSSIPYPPELISNSGIFDFRGYTILVFNLYPVHYIGDTGKIYYYKNMTVTIRTKVSGNVSPLFRGLEKDENVMKQIVDDYSKNYTYTSIPDPPSNSSIVTTANSYDFVIITNSFLVNATPWPPDVREWYTFQDLADYKNSTGINTTIVSVNKIKSDPMYWNITNQTFNDTQAQIRNFIIHAYKIWDIEYVLLGGHITDYNEKEIIPTRELWSSGTEERKKDFELPSDFYYACLNGSYNGDGDEFWGEVGDGGLGGDIFEPKVHEGISYAEADSWADYAYTFGTGLFTPPLNLTGSTNIILKFCTRSYVSSNIYANVTIYSGGTNASTSTFEETRWTSTGEDGDIEVNFNPSGYIDPSQVYIQFNYTDLKNSTERSFNIDNVSCWIGENRILWEGFEGGNFPPLNWTVINYDVGGVVYPIGNSDESGSWRREYYRIDIDLLPDIYVGRALVKDSREVSNFVYKTLTYENTTINDPYIRRALMIGELLTKKKDETGKLKHVWCGDSKDHVINQSASNGFNTTGIPTSKYKIEKLYDRDWKKPYHMWLKSELIKRLNKGYNIINLYAHGGYTEIGRPIYLGPIRIGWYFSFNITDADALCNNNYWFMYFLSCKVGGFDQDDCLANHLIKTKNGAFAVIMNSRESYPKESVRLDRLFYDAVFGKNLVKLGQAFYDLKNVTSNDIINDDTWGQKMRHSVYELNLIGDPTVSIKIPEENLAPVKPNPPGYKRILGPLYEFSAKTIDPDNDAIRYWFYFEWGGENVVEVPTGKYHESNETVYLSMILIPGKNYIIKVMAEDEFGKNSDYSNESSIAVPFNSNMEIFSSPTVLGKETQFYGQALQGANLPVFNLELFLWRW